ncbi:hypothetical protein PTKIN_Ptkin13bG0156400 [Pterospermum kingtungense]
MFVRNLDILALNSVKSIQRRSSSKELLIRCKTNWQIGRLAFYHKEVISPLLNLHWQACPIISSLVLRLQ